MNRIVHASWAVLMVGCGSSSTAAAPDRDAAPEAADVAPVPDASPGDVGPACGAGPFVREGVRVADLDDTGRERLQAGALLSFSTCSGTYGTTDSKGEARALVARGVPFQLRVDAEGHVPVLFGEEVFSVDDPITLDGHTALLPRTPVAAALPYFAPDRPSFAIVIIANGTDRCANPFDAQLEVVGHPEAKALTMNADWPTDPSPALVSGAGSVVFFTGLAGGQYVSVTGTKPGCRLRFDQLGQTGRFFLENGAFTIGNALTADPG